MIVMERRVGVSMNEAYPIAIIDGNEQNIPVTQAVFRLQISDKIAIPLTPLAGLDLNTEIVVMQPAKHAVEIAPEEPAKPEMPIDFVGDRFPEFFRASDSACHQIDGSTAIDAARISQRLERKFRRTPDKLYRRSIARIREKLLRLAFYILG